MVQSRVPALLGDSFDAGRAHLERVILRLHAESSLSSIGLRGRLT